MYPVDLLKVCAEHLGKKKKIIIKINSSPADCLPYVNRLECKSFIPPPAACIPD